jgi:hypothetical protein
LQQWPRKAGLLRQAGPEPRRDGHCYDMRSARVRMEIVLQVPAAIERNPRIGEAGLIQDAPSQHSFDGAFRAILRIHHQGHRAAPARQGGGGNQHIPRRLDTLLDLGFAVIGRQKAEKRTQP